MSVSALLELLTEDEPDDLLSRALQEAHLLLLKHPIAARAAFKAVSAEGRTFAATEEGKLWQKRLAGSDLIRRGRSVWEIGTLAMLEEPGDRLLPSQFVDALSYAAALTDLEPRLARAVEARPSDEEPG